jgi:hypothetical protein
MTVKRLSEHSASRYRDSGCEIAPECLKCWLPICKYDLPPAKRGLVRARQLRAELRRDLAAGGVTKARLASRYGISLRTVYRALSGS